MSEEEEYALNDEQWVFLFSRRYEIEDAENNDDAPYFHDIMTSDAWLKAFGDMTWEEAWNRYMSDQQY